MVEVGPSWLAESGGFRERSGGREKTEEGKGRAERGAGPRREAFIKRERTNVAIKTKPTAFVRRLVDPRETSQPPTQLGCTGGSNTRGVETANAHAQTGWN